VNGAKAEAEGVSVYIADTKKWYVGKKVIDLLK
jgi:hypothetical protein